MIVEDVNGLYGYVVVSVSLWPVAAARVVARGRAAMLDAPAVSKVDPFVVLGCRVGLKNAELLATEIVACVAQFFHVMFSFAQKNGRPKLEPEASIRSPGGRRRTAGRFKIGIIAGLSRLSRFEAFLAGEARTDGHYIDIQAHLVADGEPYL